MWYYEAARDLHHDANNIQREYHDKRKEKKLKSLQKRIIASNHVCAGNDINEEDVYNISLTLYYQ